jgi:nucleotide-binding universal stress UspA family protein
MRTFKNILLIIQGLKPETAVLNRAVALARTNDAKLTVADVVSRVPAGFPADEVGLSSAKLQELLIKTRQEELQGVSDAAEALGVRPSVQVMVGTAFLEIVRAVLRDGYDLVIKAAEGPVAHKELLFGTTDM